jgi:cyclophilin family peptidyl-prolyl cis-trans isomerase
MANKKTIAARERALQKKQTERTIQIIGAVVLGLVIIALVWLAWPEPAPAVTDLPPDTFQYNAAPEMMIDVNKTYYATFSMENGEQFVAELFANQAPITVNNFVFLAQQGYYNGTTFHRVIEGFMAQGGDPTGTGTGGPGYEFADEFSDLTFDRPGLLAMANSGPNTNGSQFFITYAPTPHLNGRHTIFGEVIEGMEVVNEITRRDPQANPDYEGDRIETVTITEE